MKYRGFIRGGQIVLIAAITEDISKLNRLICNVSYQENFVEKDILLTKKNISKEISGEFAKYIGASEDIPSDLFSIKFHNSIASSSTVIIKKIEVFLEDNNSLIEVNAVSDKFSLMYLFPEDEKQASESLWFQSSVKRHADPETLSLVAKNVMTNQSLPSYCRVNAFVIYIYKTIELDRAISLVGISSSYEEMYFLCESIDRANSSKRDGRLLQLSLMTAMWHYYIANNEIDLALKIIEDLATKDFTNEKTPLFALNMSCALLFRCLVKAKTGEFIDDAERLIDLFYYAVSIRADNSGWFVDYRGIHDKSLVAMQMKESLINKGFVDASIINKAIKCCFRINDRNFIAKVSRVIEAIK